MTSGIYVIENAKLNKRYIGASVNVRKRLSQHERRLNKNKHQNKSMQEDYINYALYFRFYPLDYVGKEKLKEKEQMYIEQFQSFESENGYNLTEKSGYSYKRKQLINNTNMYDVMVSQVITLQKQLAETNRKNIALEDEIRFLKAENRTNKGE